MRRRTTTSRTSLLRYRRDDDFAQRQLWRRCVFVDWHGVLCDQPFWHSITENPRHQQRVAVTEAAQGLFSDSGPLVDAWMRGHIDAARVVSTLQVPEDRRCGPDFLYRRLLADCRSMVPRPELLDTLRALPVMTLVVVATDNMDCFSDVVPRLRRLRGTFYAALCSSDLGVLKAEDPERFFGEWLAEQGIRPCDAVLVDDVEHNCARFEQFGGHAIHFTDPRRAAAELTRWAHSS
jgi:FMN phosphatase YigB (HAD superfamily)